MSLPYFVRQETRVTSSCQDFFPLLLSKNTTEEDKRMSETLSLFLSPVHGSLFLWLAACNWVEPALSLANFLHVSFFFVIECSVFWSFSAYITFLLVLLSLLTLFDCFLKWSCSLLYFFYLIACHFWLSKERSCSQGKVTIVHSMLVFLHPEWMSTFFDFRLRSSLHWQLWSGWEDEEIMTQEYLYWVIESLERLDGKHPARSGWQFLTLTLGIHWGKHEGMQCHERGNEACHATPASSLERRIFPWMHLCYLCSIYSLQSVSHAKSSCYSKTRERLVPQSQISTWS